MYDKYVQFRDLLPRSESEGVLPVTLDKVR